MVTGQSKQLLSLLKAQVDCDSLENLLNVGIPHTEVLSVFTADLGDGLELELRLAGNSDADKDDSEAFDGESLSDDGNDFEGLLEVGL